MTMMKFSRLGSALYLVTFASEHHVVFAAKGSSKSSKKSGKTMAPTGTPHPNPPELEFAFPSLETNVTGSSFDSTLLLPSSLAPLYAEFGGPHFAVDSFPNGCKYGVDRIAFEVEIGESPNMPVENMIGLTFSINNIEVAEQTISGEQTVLMMEDVIFPPITDPELNIKVEVAFFSGRIESSGPNEDPPSGIHITSSAGVLTLNCAPPFPIKGERAGTGAIRITEKPNTIGSITNDYTDADLGGCECNGPVQVLPATSRVEIFPKEKQYSDCNDYIDCFLPVLEEPFKEIGPAFQNVFSFSGYKLKADTSAYFRGKKGSKKDSSTSIDTTIDTTIEDLYNEVCGGSGLVGFVRLTGCECEEVPLGFDPNDVILDFEVYCPLSSLTA